MKIFLSGAQGTGKSTINKILIEKLPEYKLLDSLSGKFAKSKEDFKDFNKLKLFQTRVSLYCFSEYLDPSSFISSRSFADAYAYNKYEYKKYMDPRFKTLMDLSLELVKDLSDDCLHIYVPSGKFEVQGTNIRSGDSEFQEIIDKLILEFYEISGIKYHKLESISVEDRVQEILSLIQVN